MFYLLLALSISALVLSLILTPICRRIFVRLNLLDVPDTQRKFHAGPIPRLGGVALLCSYLCSFGLLLLFSNERAGLLARHVGLLWQLLPAVAMVFGTGLLDDIIGLKPWQKLLGQFAGAAWVSFTGIRIMGFGSFAAAGVPWWSFAVTIVWLMGCTNAFNLIDGVDGLATGIGLFATLTTLLAALMQGHMGLAIATAPLAGCLLGFLRYNFNPASIFLGDSGSLLIGFLLGCYAVIWSQKSATLLGMVAPMMALALPLMDVGLSIVRRYLNVKPIFGADRGHIHHRLLARGWNPREVALALYLVCGIAAVFSLLQSLLYYKVGGVVIVLFCGASYFGVRHLNYIEFRVARNLLVGGTFRRVLQEQIYLRNLQLQLETAKSMDEYWTMVVKMREDLGLEFVSMQIAGRKFEDGCLKDSSRAWRLQVDFPDSGYLRIGGSPESSDTLPILPLLRVFQDNRSCLPMHLRQEPAALTESAPDPSSDASRLSHV